MNYTCFECGMPNSLTGGFGDRMIGVASCLSLSDLLKTKFLIKWDDFDLSEYFEYSPYNFYNLNESVNFTPLTNYVRYLHDLRDLGNFFSQINLLSELGQKNVIFNTNQNIWQFYYSNIHIQEGLEPYELLTKKLFDKIFKECLIPKKNICDEVSNLIDPNKKWIGVQLRFGDPFMNKQNSFNLSPQPDHYPLGDNPQVTLDYLEKKIYEMSDKNFFITSDIDLSNSNILDNPRVAYYKLNPVHIERSSDKRSMIKTFVDFFCLTKCESIIITKDSNFGRISSIASGSDSIYALNFVNGEICETKRTIKELSCKSY